MKPVVVVGDRPSPKNVCPLIAFVGAACEARLREWLAFIQPELYFLTNAHNEHGHVSEELLKYVDYAQHFQFLALGLQASITLDQLNIQHYRLPHPSGLNRALNNASELQKSLNRAYIYIRGGLD